MATQDQFYLTDGYFTPSLDYFVYTADAAASVASQSTVVAFGGDIKTTILIAFDTSTLTVTPNRIRNTNASVSSSSTVTETPTRIRSVTTALSTTTSQTALGGKLQSVLVDLTPYAVNYFGDDYAFIGGIASSIIINATKIAATPYKTGNANLSSNSTVQIQPIKVGNAQSNLNISSTQTTVSNRTRNTTVALTDQFSTTLICRATKNDQVNLYSNSNTATIAAIIRTINTALSTTTSIVATGSRSRLYSSAQASTASIVAVDYRIRSYQAATSAAFSLTKTINVTKTTNITVSSASVLITRNNKIVQFSAALTDQFSTTLICRATKNDQVNLYSASTLTEITSRVRNTSVTLSVNSLITTIAVKTVNIAKTLQATTSQTTISKKVTGYSSNLTSTFSQTQSYIRIRTDASAEYALFTIGVVCFATKNGIDAMVARSTINITGNCNATRISNLSSNLTITIQPNKTTQSNISLISSSSIVIIGAKNSLFWHNNSAANGSPIVTDSSNNVYSIGSYTNTLIKLNKFGVGQSTYNIFTSPSNAPATFYTMAIDSANNILVGGQPPTMGSVSSDGSSINWSKSGTGSISNSNSVQLRTVKTVGSTSYWAFITPYRVSTKTYEEIDIVQINSSGTLVNYYSGGHGSNSYDNVQDIYPTVGTIFVAHSTFSGSGAIWKVTQQGVGTYSLPYSTTINLTNIVADSSNNIYVCGYDYTNNNFIIKLNNAGVFQWQRNISVLNINAGTYDLKIDSSNNLYLASYDGSVGTIIKMNASGTVLWKKQVLNQYGPTFVSLSIQNGIVYGSGSSGLYTFSEQGENITYDDGVQIVDNTSTTVSTPSTPYTWTIGSNQISLNSGGSYSLGSSIYSGTANNGTLNGLSSQTFYAPSIIYQFNANLTSSFTQSALGISRKGTNSKLTSQSSVSIIGKKVVSSSCQLSTTSTLNEIVNCIRNFKINLISASSEVIVVAKSSADVANLTSSSTLVAAPVKIGRISQTVNSTSTLTEVTKRTRGVTAFLQANSNCSITAYRIRPISVSIASTTQLTCVDSAVDSAQANLSSYSTLTETTNRLRGTSVSLTSTSTITALIKRTRSTQVNFNSTTSSNINAYRIKQFSAALTDQFSTTLTCRATKNDQVNLYSTSSQSVVGKKTVGFQANLSSSSLLHLNVTFAGSANLVSRFSLTAIDYRTEHDQANLASTSSITIQAQRIRNDQTNLASATTLTEIPTRIRQAQIHLSALASELTVDVATRTVTAHLTSISSQTSTVIRTRTDQAHFGANSTLSANVGKLVQTTVHIQALFFELSTGIKIHIDPNLTWPISRDMFVWTIESELDTWLIDTESRTQTIEAEDRSQQIESEQRTYIL